MKAAKPPAAMARDTRVAQASFMLIRLWLDLDRDLTLISTWQIYDTGDASSAREGMLPRSYTYVYSLRWAVGSSRG